ncbi:MAG TPA: hypothetical protein VMS08_05750 [Candidatus Saccharimonadia bacterium]|nr:hypothetical protein [Candidatus Saccharimonadia bacterium]
MVDFTGPTGTTGPTLVAGTTLVAGPAGDTIATGTTGVTSATGPSSEHGQHYPHNSPGVGTQYDGPGHVGNPIDPATGRGLDYSGPTGWTGQSGPTGGEGFLKHIEHEIEHDFEKVFGHGHSGPTGVAAPPAVTSTTGATGFFGRLEADAEKIV